MSPRQRFLSSFLESQKSLKISSEGINSSSEQMPIDTCSHTFANSLRGRVHPLQPLLGSQVKPHPHLRALHRRGPRSSKNSTKPWPFCTLMVWRPQLHHEKLLGNGSSWKYSWPCCLRPCGEGEKTHRNFKLGLQGSLACNLSVLPEGGSAVIIALFLQAGLCVHISGF